MAGAAGVATSITGGVAALGMSMYGDLLDNGLCRRNVETEEELEAMETV
jgi:hypothetical protein